MLTIITVILNDKKGLERTLNSLINEDKNKYEHLLIDGGSNDGTVEYIKTRRTSKELSFFNNISNYDGTISFHLCMGANFNICYNYIRKKKTK